MLQETKSQNFDKKIYILCKKKDFFKQEDVQVSCSLRPRLSKSVEHFFNVGPSLPSPDRLRKKKTLFRFKKRLF